jgi:hypothetical protein
MVAAMLDIVKDDWLVSQPQNGGGIGYLVAGAQLGSQLWRIRRNWRSTLLQGLNNGASGTST